MREEFDAQVRYYKHYVPLGNDKIAQKLTFLIRFCISEYNTALKLDSKSSTRKNKQATVTCNSKNLVENLNSVIRTGEVKSVIDISTIDLILENLNKIHIKNIKLLDKNVLSAATATTSHLLLAEIVIKLCVGLNYYNAMFSKIEKSKFIWGSANFIDFLNLDSVETCNLKEALSELDTFIFLQKNKIDITVKKTSLALENASEKQQILLSIEHSLDEILPSEG
jgi:hypothetical protein